MYCRNCGSELDDKAVACTSCGVAPLDGTAFCPNCRNETIENAIVCVACGTGFQKHSSADGSSTKIAAGLCGILLGSLGVHKFLLGYTTEGVIMLLITILTFGFGAIATGPIGLIEGIIYITKSDEEFERTYVDNKKAWF